MEIPVPEGLSSLAAAWWSRIREEYDIRDGPGLMALEAACRGFDLAESARRELAEAGVLVIEDRFKQARPHPLIKVRNDATASMLAALRQLNVDPTEVP